MMQLLTYIAQLPRKLSSRCLLLIVVALAAAMVLACCTVVASLARAARSVDIM
jgi:hypothetical protein